MKRNLNAFNTAREKKDMELDKELRKKARQIEISTPPDFELEMDKLLSTLSDEKGSKRIRRKEMRRERIRQRMNKPTYRIVRGVAVASVAITFGFVSLAAYGLGFPHEDHMSELTTEEVTEYNDLIQDSPAGIDYYSRELSYEERLRMEALWEACMTEDDFPSKSLTRISSVIEWNGDEIAYLAATGTFYIPERELTDEELLSLKTFIEECNYSLKSMNAEASAECQPQQVEISEEQRAVAAEAIKAVLGVDVSEKEYIVYSGGLGEEREICFEWDNGMTYYVILERETNAVWDVGEISESAQGDCTEDFNIDKAYTQILECLSNPIWKQSEIEHVTMKYYKYKDTDIIPSGMIRFLVELSDGSGYSLGYSKEEQRIVDISYYKKCPKPQMWYVYNAEYIEQKTLTSVLREVK